MFSAKYQKIFDNLYKTIDNINKCIKEEKLEEAWLMCFITERMIGSGEDKCTRQEAVQLEHLLGVIQGQSEVLRILLKKDEQGF